jgi:hypothetical protein
MAKSGLVPTRSVSNVGDPMSASRLGPGEADRREKWADLSDDGTQSHGEMEVDGRRNEFEIRTLRAGDQRRAGSPELNDELNV